MTLKQFTSNFLFFSGIAFCTVYFFLLGMEKEAARMEAVGEHRCATYGDLINEHYGRDVCPSNNGG